ncbi:branched-chain-amino-acid aminotransferase [Cyclospora cayetanensis]|uniref:Branched-chain-amino-acid aminotransferase n=1 Tax=Cyclospora cayetanensis TaxID=88456 RepID=A0A1D3DAQ8_9EIME|nr:branched-chain-amino-acid aminotransferase [Cyclospora cayetanensis]
MQKGVYGKDAEWLQDTERGEMASFEAAQPKAVETGGHMCGLVGGLEARMRMVEALERVVWHVICKKKAVEGASRLQPFSLQQLSIEPRIGDRPPVPPTKGLGFASTYSSMMCEADWSDQTGWLPPKILPLRELALHPGSTALHYGISCLEGLKASKSREGRLLLFRPEDHIQRFILSAERLALPTVESKPFLELLKRFVQIEEAYVPAERGCSLYLRPLLFSTYVRCAQTESRIE